MKKNEFDYGKAMTEIEELIEKLQSNDSNVDMLIPDAEKAMKLISQCKQHITDTETKLDKLFEEN
jgi:exodeoxyribonuclease VII small subunit